MATSILNPATDLDEDEPRPAWLIVRPWQVVALSVTSFGLYLLYWQFEQWSALKAASLRVAWGRHRDVQPYWRGVFSLFFLYPLFVAMRDDLRARGAASFRPALLVAVYFLVPWIVAPVAGALLPAPLPFLVWLTAFGPLVVVQRALNAANAARGATADPYAEMTALHWIVLVVGGLLTLGRLAGRG